MFTLIPVILSSEKGKGLWPLNSEQSPKQFLRLGKKGESLFAAAYKRALMVAPSRNIIIVTQKDFARRTWVEIRNINKLSKSQAIIEPCNRNTSAAIAMAAIHALNYFENPVLWVMPSDHYIEKPFSLINAVQESAHAAYMDKIVTFGTLPLKADSNYGHMICGQELYNYNNLFSVDLFLEKPQGKRLEWFMQQKNCVWNSGMFLFSAHNILKHIKTRMKSVVDYAAIAYKTSKPTQIGLLAKHDVYKHIPSISIEKLVIENNENLVVRPVDIGWSGIVTWQCLTELYQKKSFDGVPLEKFLLHAESVA